MEFKDYQKQVQSLTPLEGGNQKEIVARYALSLSEEAGEVIRPLKRHYFRGEKLDRENLVEEMGDTLWCLTQIANAMGLTIEEIAQQNLNKILIKNSKSRG